MIVIAVTNILRVRLRASTVRKASTVSPIACVATPPVRNTKIMARGNKTMMTNLGP
jgi:hypothetical protein